MRMLLFLATAALAFSQSGDRPDVTNARFETRAFTGSLAPQFPPQEVAWFGYEIATIRHDDDNDRYGNCDLENERVQKGLHVQPVHLEASSKAALLFRVSSNRVEKIRLYSMGCRLDAGGRRFVWLTNVPEAASLAYLESLITTSQPGGVPEAAIFAIAQHESLAADGILEKLARSAPSEHLREQAIFWLGASRGRQGVAILRNILSHSGDDQLRAKAVFALSISAQPDALESIVHAAEQDSSPHVRSQALFWLAQKAGNKAARTLDSALASDPDRSVKRQAVFAMSQLPKDEAIPKLIEIARTQRDPEIRRQAIFWLGQSNDPRALAFFRQLLLQ